MYVLCNKPCVYKQEQYAYAHNMYVCKVITITRNPSKWPQIYCENSHHTFNMLHMIKMHAIWYSNQLHLL